MYTLKFCYFLAQTQPLGYIMNFEILKILKERLLVPISITLEIIEKNKDYIIFKTGEGWYYKINEKGDFVNAYL
jgi:hypothetical protein